jgi:hypothetical protein
MSPDWIKVRNPKDDIYQTLVEQYWNWLLDEEKVVDNPKKKVNGEDVFFMRMIYGYGNRWEINPDTGVLSVSRKNVLTNNRMGADKDKKLELSSGKPIFLPVIDSCECDFDKDSSGMPLTPGLMNKILEAENNDVERNIRNGRVRSTVRRLEEGKNTPPHDIVDDLTNYHIGVPGRIGGTGTFQLKIPENSRLAQTLEFEFPRGKTVNARAEGIYLIFEINKPGLYQIRSSAEGLRGYIADMNYRIQITTP